MRRLPNLFGKMFLRRDCDVFHRNLAEEEIAVCKSAVSFAPGLSLTRRGGPERVRVSAAVGGERSGGLGEGKAARAKPTAATLSTTSSVSLRFLF